MISKYFRDKLYRYFNERLEGKQLKAEIENLTVKINSLRTSNEQDRSKSRPKTSKPIGTDVSKKTLQEVSKENDTLKMRIQKLEQECNSLTYYRETMLASGNSGFSIDNFDPGMRRANHESDTLRNKLEETTIFVKKFLLAMKRLQRGVKNKDPNNKSLKIEFERSKKDLENW